ncbi:MAG: hypothetical protein KF785_11295 [Gemmatimonadales bacterium]|nr:hypothetical protein [Gemmatimonadales bacterium]
MKVTARVRRLVDDVHDGDLLAASVHAGVPYKLLRELHAGRAKQPDTRTLARLARTYHLPIDWFFEGTAADDGTVPMVGWTGYVHDPGTAGSRRITIPIAAWPLIRVLVQLELRLRDQPADPDRPIIGEATDPREIRSRLTSFIFQPLLAARPISAMELGSRALVESQWVEMLRDLGRFWERALGSLLAGLPEFKTSEPIDHTT